MKNDRWMKPAALLQAAGMLCSMAGCGPEVQAVDLMEGITAQSVVGAEDLSQGNAAMTDFAVRLLQAGAAQDENTLLSPLSVLCALAMTANGARGETLSQMETALGMDYGTLNRYLYSYMNGLSQGEKHKLLLANSIWFADGGQFAVNRDFLQTNADYYSADVYEAPFDDSTCDDINRWVKEKTNGMIPTILDRIPDEAVMYLVNALAFEAEWMEPYEEMQVEDGIFTCENGETQNVSLMYSEENAYLEDEYAVGFLKYYSGGKYAFAAMLPKDGVTVAEYVAALEGDALHSMLSQPQITTVQTAIPKFETEYSTNLAGVLQTMGMKDAFDAAAADLRGLGTASSGNMAIGRVLHKTYISVGEQGTKAGAATAVEVLCKSAPDLEEPKIVYLDRPFVYMLIDCETNTPFFMGTMMNVKE